jgi:chitinase
VPIVTDATSKPRDLTVTLSAPVNATLVRATAVGTITNDDNPPLPTLSIADVTVTEGTGGSTTASFVVTFVGVVYADGDEHVCDREWHGDGGSDYTAVSGTVTFPAGSTTQTVTVRSSPTRRSKRTRPSASRCRRR